MCEAFQVEDLAWMIRATRGRSMDGWMDGWRRPNHMPSHFDALQTLPPVNFRRLARGLHSVAKQASFSVAFRSDFEGFWGGLGRFLETKMDAQIGFGRLFGDAFFKRVFASIFCHFWGAPILKNHALA